MTLETHQNVFIVFFAIFWGAVANVQPRWKAFQWPLMFKPELRVVLRRVLLAFLVMNVLPVVYFGLTLWIIDGRGPSDSDSLARSAAKLVMQGVLPAFGMFALYRIWLGIVELWPDCFYKHEVKDIPERYRHVEPTYRQRWNETKESNMPVVDLGEDAGSGNLLAALFYLILAHLLPWISA